MIRGEKTRLNRVDEDRWVKWFDDGHIHIAIDQTDEEVPIVWIRVAMVENHDDTAMLTYNDLKAIRDGINEALARMEEVAG